MKKIIFMLVLLIGCSTMPQYTEEERVRMEEQRIRWKIEKQLNEDRLKDECYKCDCCKGQYKYYNRSYILKKK